MSLHRSIFLIGFLSCLGWLHPGAAFGQNAALDAVEPPRVTKRVEATYPAPAGADANAADVVLFVTIERDGTVSDVRVVESAGAAFDAAAVAAVHQWRFEPARRGDAAVASRIRIPFHFVPPPSPAAPLAREREETQPPSQAPPTEPPPAGSTAQTNPGAADAASPEPPEPVEVTVHANPLRRTEHRSSGDFIVTRDVLEAAPRQEGADMLRTAPGLYIGRGEGASVAHNYMLRGFDAEHGQDIEFKVGGLPINAPSHLHGQGYADLGFLVGEAVYDLHVSEGVYDPRQGDFAVAGSIDVDLGVVDRGIRLSSGYGRFGTFRQLVLWAPPQGDVESFGAAQYSRTDGFGENRDGQGASAIFQQRFGGGNVVYRALGIVYGTRSSLAGVVRTDDVSAGRVCFYCVYPYPTARAQNGFANRVLAGIFAEYQAYGGGNGDVGLWFGHDVFRLQQNFTGFTQRSRTLERVAGRGDLIEQQNRTLSVGLTGRYRGAPLALLPGVEGTVEIGADARADVIDQAQNLLDAAVRRQTWDRRIDAGVRALDVGFWGDLEIHADELLRVRAGFRADALSYEVDDRLGNFAPLSRPDDAFIVGFRRSAFGVAAGPRTSLELSASSWLSLLAAYGEGYRSPQARLLEDGESAPFTKVRSGDLGLRMRFGAPLRLTLGGYVTELSDDVAFEADEGRLERIGATRRIGAVAHAVSRGGEWLVAAASVTYARATLLEPPPATVEEPDPPFVQGQSLPFVPPLVVRADAGVEHPLFAARSGKPLVGRAGLGFSFLSARPLPFDAFADPVALLDASAAVQYAPFDLTFEIYNLLDRRYAAVEYNFASDWDPEAPRPRTPARHSAAAAPLSWMLTLGVTL
jgi:TonB family protein